MIGLVYKNSVVKKSEKKMDFGFEDWILFVCLIFSCSIQLAAHFIYF